MVSAPSVALVTNCRAYAGPGSVDGLVGAGHTVFCHDRSFVDDHTRATWGAEHPDAHALAEQGPEALVARVLESAGRIDALVSNDVVSPRPDDFATCSADDCRAMLEDGYVWPFRLARAAVEPMKGQRRGAIIFVTSATARDPQASSVLYSSIRAGATAMAVALGRSLGKHGITVNAIGPSWFENPSYFPPGWEEARPQRATQFRTYGTLDRLGTQEEMGRLVAFLADRAVLPITAQYIDFSGSSPP
jgi:NAD(P)-dependent dehydrogenase (short-subunit alcohol dehydrogenase family)